MYLRSKLLVSIMALGTVWLAGPANAEIWIEGHRNAPKTSCAGRYDTAEATCTFPAVGGRTFAVSGFGAVAFIVSLEVASDVAGAPAEIIARCDGFAADGCIGGRGYNSVPIAKGTPLTCRAWGIGQGTFECATFRLE